MIDVRSTCGGGRLDPPAPAILTLHAHLTALAQIWRGDLESYRGLLRHKLRTHPREASSPGSGRSESRRALSHADGGRLLQTPADYWGKNSGEEMFRIYGNDLVHGVLDKAQFGSYGLVHAVQVRRRALLNNLSSQRRVGV